MSSFKFIGLPQQRWEGRRNGKVSPSGKEGAASVSTGRLTTAKRAVCKVNSEPNDTYTNQPESGGQ